MRLLLEVDNRNRLKYKEFCYKYLFLIKSDMLRFLDERKIESRNSRLDKILRNKFNYLALYKKCISTMYLRANNGFYEINFDDSIKIGGIYKIYMIIRMIEYGVKDIEPYPYIRRKFSKYKKSLNNCYEKYLKEGKIDLSL